MSLFDTWPDGTRFDDDNTSLDPREPAAPTTAAPSKPKRGSSANTLEAETTSEPKRRRALRPTTAAQPAAPPPNPGPGAVVNAQEQPALWRLVAVP